MHRFVLFLVMTSLIAACDTTSMAKGCHPTEEMLTPAQSPQKDREALIREITQLVRQNFYDPARAADWPPHPERMAKSDDQAEFTAHVNAALADLGASHTQYYAPPSAEYFGLLSIFRESLGVGPVSYDSAGADFELLQGRYFVRRVYAGGPAAKAGLLRGDCVTLVDGFPFKPDTAFTGKAGRDVVLTLQRSRGGASTELHVTPRQIDPKVEWLEAQKAGTQVMICNGTRIGYIPFLSGTGEEFQEAVQEAITVKFREADAMVLDLRGDFGGCNPDFVNLFNPTVPSLVYTDKQGKRVVIGGSWHKPLFLLVDGSCRSGKEVVAYAIQKHHVGVLVGERTAGAVIAGRPFLLSDKTLLYLAVSDVRVDGVRLEGKGVQPGVVVSSALPYAAGGDPQLEKALDLAATGHRRKQASSR